MSRLQISSDGASQLRSSAGLNDRGTCVSDHRNSHYEVSVYDRGAQPCMKSWGGLRFSYVDTAHTILQLHKTMKYMLFIQHYTVSQITKCHKYSAIEHDFAPSVSGRTNDHHSHVKLGSVVERFRSMNGCRFSEHDKHIRDTRARMLSGITKC